jgi:hypothetical protein
LASKNTADDTLWNISLKTKSEPECSSTYNSVVMEVYRIWPLPLFLVMMAALQQTPSQNIQKRVSPDAYSSAPATIRAALKRQHCELPETQHWDQTRLTVVSGHFGDRAQTDWAAICIAPDGSTRVLVFWGKSAPCAAEIHDGWALRGRFPPGEAGSLYLLAAPAQDILTYRKFFKDAQENPVTHEGIEVGGEEASQIYYCYHGQWLVLTGND